MQTASLGAAYSGTQGPVCLVAVCQGDSGFEGALLPAWLVEIQRLQGPVLRDISFCINVALGSFFPNIYKSAFLLQICLP